MKAITIDKIEDGMVLAQDVLNPKGQILIKSGVTLDDYYINVLNKFNVDVIMVSGDRESREMSREERAALMMQVRPGKKMIFQKCITDPFIYEMYEAVVQNSVWEKWNEK
ncbi:MAG: hypothetical protein RBS16_04255 [Candidatus Cloacimonadales bacterium]|jgi:cyanate lyase|nr:hypothetical protein [Candidatus Cloacimonadota bacterium]MDX9977227.1 hypothetical protein [Candidatus Cloacimonadales bacterium]